MTHKGHQGHALADITSEIDTLAKAARTRRRNGEGPIFFGATKKARQLTIFVLYTSGGEGEARGASIQSDARIRFGSGSAVSSIRPRLAR